MTEHYFIYQLSGNMPGYPVFLEQTGGTMITDQKRFEAHGEIPSGLKIPCYQDYERVLGLNHIHIETKGQKSIAFEYLWNPPEYYVSEPFLKATNKTVTWSCPLSFTHKKERINSHPYHVASFQSALPYVQIETKDKKRYLRGMSENLPEQDSCYALSLSKIGGHFICGADFVEQIKTQNFNLAVLPINTAIKVLAHIADHCPPLIPNEELQQYKV